MQAGPLYCCASERNRSQVRNRSHGTCTPQLIVYAQNLCQGLLCLEFVRNGPAGELAGITQMSLHIQFIYLDHNSIRSKRQVMALLVPIVNEIFYLGNILAQAQLVAYRQAPFCSLGQSL